MCASLQREAVKKRASGGGAAASLRKKTLADGAARDDQVKPSLSAKALRTQGKALREEGKWDEAVVAFRAAAAVDPNDDGDRRASASAAPAGGSGLPAQVSNGVSLARKGLISSTLQMSDCHVLRRAEDAAHTKVLACAFSNVAADNLVAGLTALGVRVVRLGHPASVRPNLAHLSLDAILAGGSGARAAPPAATTSSADADATDDDDAAASPATTNGVPSELSRARRRLAAASKGGAAEEGKAAATRELGFAVARATHRVIRDADVVVCTCSGAGAETLKLATAPERRLRLRPVRFATVLIDEASQATEPACLVPLLHGARRRHRLLVRKNPRDGYCVLPRGVGSVAIAWRAFFSPYYSRQKVLSWQRRAVLWCARFS